MLAQGPQSTVLAAPVNAPTLAAAAASRISPPTAPLAATVVPPHQPLPQPPPPQPQPQPQDAKRQRTAGGLPEHAAPQSAQPQPATAAAAAVPRRILDDARRVM